MYVMYGPSAEKKQNKTKMARVETWPLRKKHLILTEINEAILLGPTEYWRLLCLPRRICRFSKIAAQSQAISLHELCQQNFLFSVIFKRVRSRSHHQKRICVVGLFTAVYITHQHRTPNEWSKKLCELVSGHKRLTKNSAGNKFLLGS